MWIHLAAVCLTACTLCIVLRRRIEAVLPFMVCASMPVLLVLAALRRLSWVDGLAAALTAGVLVWLVLALARRKLAWADVRHGLEAYVLTPGLACFVLLAVFWAISCQGRAVLNYDEFNYWATQVRSFYVSGGIVNGMQSCCLEHAAYPPGMQLVEWWFMHLRGEWHEGTLYMAAFLVNSMFFLPLTERFSWKKPYQIPLFVAAVILLPTALSSESYHFLHVDSTLGALFGLVLYTAWTKREHQHLMLAAQMTALALCKQTGILWIGFALVFMLYVQRVRWTRRWTAVVLCPLAAMAGWSLCCWIFELNTWHIEALQSGVEFEWAHVLSVWRGMAKILLAQPLSMSGAWNEAMPLLGLPAAAWIVVFCGMFISGGVRLDCKCASVRCCRWMVAVFAVTTAVMAVSMFTVFAQEVHRWARSRSNIHCGLDRYMMPLFYGGAVLGCTMLMERWKSIRWTAVRKGVAAASAALLLLCVNWPMASYLLPEGYAKNFPQNNGSEWMRENFLWYQQLRDEECRVLTSGGLTLSYRYALVPLSFEKVPDEIAASYERLEAYIDETACTHVVLIGSDHTQTLLQEAFQQEIQPDTAYRIDKSQKPYRLETVGTALQPERGSP